MTDIERKELETRRAYALRQFEGSKAHATVYIARGDARSLEYAENHIRNMWEINDTIDYLTRRLEGLEDPVDDDPTTNMSHPLNV